MCVFLSSFARVEGERCGGGFERVCLDEGLAGAGEMVKRDDRRGGLGVGGGGERRGEEGRTGRPETLVHVWMGLLEPILAFLDCSAEFAVLLVFLVSFLHAQYHSRVVDSNWSREGLVPLVVTSRL